MATHKKNIKRHPQPVQPVKKVPQKPSVPDNSFAAIVTALYAIVVFTGIFHHEPWRDEIQAWLIARDSHSIPTLFQNMKFEGHPALWHLLLFGLTAVTDNLFSMQLLHGVFAVATIYLFVRYIPLDRVQKILFVCGYFLIFEYSIIARDYLPGIFFMFLFMILYQVPKRNNVYLGVTLFLMANTNVYALIIAICLLMVWVIDTFKQREKLSAVLFSGFAVAVTGMVLSVLQINPDEHGRFYLQYMYHFDMPRLRFAMADMVRAFVPVHFFILPFWNTNLMIKDQINISDGIFFLSIAIFLLFAFLFLRNRNAFLFYVSATLGILTFTYLTFLPYPRYVGHLYIIFFVAYWFGKMHPATKSSFAIISFSNTMYKMRHALLFVLLIVQSVAGIYSWYMDVKNVFSQSHATAEYLKKEHLDKYKLIGFSDMATSGITGWLNKPMYYIERNEPGTFIKWDDVRKVNLTIQNIADETFRQTRNKKEPVIFISNSELNANGVPITDMIFIDSVKMTLLDKFAPSIVADESFYVYRMQRVK